ncbi:hypothetical protein GALMADRAFT_204981 [Galerina marginata CBS 339.88]|uniref:WLM domain-containing protein n=1 Tax=Galerina marginata (strain CBS 339.88) TaxID=685588 RepID=A0A067TZZ1_GALM3|nr:hypothetical protein GALMADRAFT_204981 [Galerina marginata CBS 339.88]
MPSDVFVLSFTHLKDKPNANGALHILEKVASLVKPIMRKRGWVLPVLAEFFPDNPNLLDVNMGQKILVRLRPAHSPDSFLPEEDVVGTMLHELTHNVHGPHDDKFYKYLDGLQDEYDELQRSGYAGEGFFSEGKRLGANISHNVSPHMARLKAMEAAEKRAQTSRVLGSGGRLGGLGRTAGLTPRELAARAAEKRARDEKSCASGADAQREADKAAKESIESKVIDLTLDDDSDMHNSGSDSDVVIVEDLHPVSKVSASAVAGPSRKVVPKLKTAGKTLPRSADGSRPSSSSSLGKASHFPTQKLTNAATRKLQPLPPSHASEWSCSACTLLNPANALQCDACQLRKPLDERQGWACLTCGEAGNPHEHWTCRFCGVVKLHS